jgi:hypothetical protein
MPHFFVEKEASSLGHPYPVVKAAQEGSTKASGSGGSWLPPWVSAWCLQGSTVTQKLWAVATAAAPRTDGDLQSR